MGKDKRIFIMGEPVESWRNSQVHINKKVIRALRIHFSLTIVLVLSSSSLYYDYVTKIAYSI